MGHQHAAPSSARRLLVALGVLAVFLVVELVGALVSGSLTLLADAGHMVSDLIGLSVALAATLVAAKPATERSTFGYQRAEVLGALINGLVLVAVAGFVGVEAVRRLSAPEDAPVQPVPMLLVAAAGLLANLVALGVLRGGRRETINLRGAYLEVLGDLLGSVAAIVAAVVILLTGFQRADPLASLVVAVLLLPRAMSLLRDVMSVLTESVPSGTDLAAIRDHICSAAGVVAVHDVHVWAITHGAPVFTAHVVVEADVFRRGETDRLLDELAGCLEGHFDVAHSTFQLEPAGHAEHEEHRHA
ncbi:MAG: cation transporter [Naasia sp.]|jgi:cobalt-zinc-cadmium efflux system protein|uniref:cation diffusion facilitator family transporter n=1 Tax=Naasia sp. TaxID=2546198 RepID=UPI00261611D6|nr:cation diffusion facilitator family transporter [Naasia sp.]MCU1571521.1 cation transporter [Naasia sp.]